MSKQVLWVIKQKENDFVFPTLKEAKASMIGFDDWFFGSSNNIRIISRVVLDRFRKRKQKGTNG
jgi:hypothetical protein